MGIPNLKVRVDRASCCGYGICAVVCPEIYKLDEAGMAYVESEDVPTGLEEKAREGAESCPQLAIHVTEVS